MASLAELRDAYSKLNVIDVESDLYRGILRQLDALPQNQLKVLALAEIKFISKLAANRIIRS